MDDIINLFKNLDIETFENVKFRMINNIRERKTTIFIDNKHNLDKLLKRLSKYFDNNITIFSTDNYTILKNTKYNSTVILKIDK